MAAIEIKDEIIENIERLEKYLCEGIDDERDFAITLSLPPARIEHKKKTYKVGETY